MNEIKYIGMDVHQKATSIVVLNETGKKLSATVVQTQAQDLLAFIQAQRGTLVSKKMPPTWKRSER
jgi:hypothetical protein